ncbi:MAG: hypothetical protein ACTSQ8_27175 [Candidatus Helarchaeota archaeon]
MRFSLVFIGTEGSGIPFFASIIQTTSYQYIFILGPGYLIPLLAVSICSVLFMLRKKDIDDGDALKSAKDAKK